MNLPTTMKTLQIESPGHAAWKDAAVPVKLMLPAKLR